jgi:methionyl-tRNA formyltransferase
MGGIVQAGRTAYTKLKQLLAGERDVKASQSLDNSAADPNDEDYAHKLQKELARLAASSPSAAEQLQAIAAEIRGSAPIHANLTFTNQAPNYGAQGQFFDRVEINPPKPGEHGEK